MDQGSTKKRSAVHNSTPTVTKFCVMWEGQALPHDTKFGNCRCEIVGRRVIFIWSLIHGSSWSGLIKAEPGWPRYGTPYGVTMPRWVKEHILWKHMKFDKIHYSARDGVSNHQRFDCLLTCLSRRRSKKTSKLRVTDLCEGNSPVTADSPHKGPVTQKMFPFDGVIMMCWILTSRSYW